MILWLSVLGVCVLTGVAVARWLDRSDRRAHDTDWGDWPPDQMAP